MAVGMLALRIMIKGWHQRGYLPHYDGGEIWQFVTVHLSDALPSNIIWLWQQELKINQVKQIKDEAADLELRRKVERYLDKGIGSCFLSNECIAKLTQNSLLHFGSIRYDLAAWVIMPNHLHFLIKPFPGIELSGILHSIKSYTASEANRILKRKAHSGRKITLTVSFETQNISRKRCTTLKTIRSKPACAKNLKIGATVVLMKKMEHKENPQMERGHPCPQVPYKKFK